MLAKPGKLGRKHLEHEVSLKCKLLTFCFGSLMDPLAIWEGATSSHRWSWRKKGNPFLWSKGMPKQEPLPRRFEPFLHVGGLLREPSNFPQELQDSDESSTPVGVEAAPPRVILIFPFLEGSNIAVAQASQGNLKGFPWVGVGNVTKPAMTQECCLAPVRATSALCLLPTSHVADGPFPRRKQHGTGHKTRGVWAQGFPKTFVFNRCPP